MKIQGVLPQNLDIGVRQRLEALTAAANASGGVDNFSVTLPAATGYLPGGLIVVRASNGVSTLYVCLLNSSGVKEWQPVIQSS